MRHAIALLAVPVALAGCAGMLDPYQRAGTWSNAGINDDNLRAMVSNPLDLQRGSGSNVALGQGAAAAVGRYRTDTVKDLPNSTLSSVGGTGGSGGAGNNGNTGGTQ